MHSTAANHLPHRKDNLYEGSLHEESQTTGRDTVRRCGASCFKKPDVYTEKSPQRVTHQKDIYVLYHTESDDVRCKAADKVIVDNRPSPFAEKVTEMPVLFPESNTAMNTPAPNTDIGAFDSLRKENKGMKK